MKLLDKIKKFFQSKDTLLVETPLTKPEIKDVNEFLLAKKHECKIQLDGRTESLFIEIDPILNKLREHIIQLENLDISKNKAEEKIIKMADIGRKEYIILINKLIESLSSRETYKPKQIKNKIKEFAKNSAKSDFKVTLLVGKEIENIRNDITKINSLEYNFLEENQTLINNIDLLDSLSEKNEELKRNKKTKTDIEQEIEKNKKSTINQESKLQISNNEIEKTKKSPSYLKKLSLEEELEKNKEALKLEELKVRTLLDNKIIEKYAYIEQEEPHKKLAEKYLENPAKELQKDKDLQILNLIEKIKDHINQGELKIKEPKKAIEKIDTDKNTLLGHQSNLSTLSELITSIENESNELKIDPGMAELKMEKAKLEQEIEKSQSALSSLTRNQEKITKTINILDSDLKDKLNSL